MSNILGKQLLLMKYKRHLILILFFLAGQFTYSYGQNKYSLSGTMPNGYNNRLIYLELNDYYSLKKYRKIDSVFILNNKFVFNGTINKETECANLYLKYNDRKFPWPFYMQFLIDRGDNFIQVTKIDTNYAQNKLYDTKNLSSSTNDLLRQEDSLRFKYYKLHAIHNLGNSASSYLPKEKAVELNSLLLELITKHTDNFYSLIYLRFRLALGIDKGNEEILLYSFQKLAPRLKSTELGREIDSLLKVQIKDRNLSSVGKVVPDFAVKTFEGTYFHNKDLLGQPYLIVFSATWCGPCQKELPKLLDLYQKYKSQGLKVIYFNLDDNIKIWQEHIKKNKLVWINVSERIKFAESKIAKQFYTDAIPNTFLIDRTGKIIYNSARMDRNREQLENYIQKVL